MAGTALRVFELPDLGEGLTEAEVVEWLVSPGERVVADQPMLSVETAKAVVEIPAPRSGRIRRLLAERGARVPVGGPLVEFEGGEDGAPDAGTVVGSVPGPARAARDGRGAAGVLAAPAVRALAKRLGVDLSAVAASGPGGAPTTADVEHAARAGGASAGFEPLQGLRREMARSMQRAHSEVAQATLWEDADVQDWAPGTDLTSRLIRAVVAGVSSEPGLNAWFDASMPARQLLPRVDLGVATDTPEGLLVPVLRDAASHPPQALRTELERLKTQARERTLAPAELRAQSFTLSNFGTLAGRYATPLVPPPTVAILAAGRARDEVRAVEGRVTIRRLLPLSLGFDHRAVTGGEAARFLAAVIRDLEAAS